jgi:DNA adenine methylase
VHREALHPLGGRQLLGKPQGFGAYREPFLGGGAVFLAARAAGWRNLAVLSDTNPDLVALYLVVRDQLDSMLELLDGAVRDREQYARAARAYYLNRCGFNGLWRVNRSGAYNVPYGGDKDASNPLVVDKPALRAASKALARTRINLAGFEAALELAFRGDRVYLDPPYHDGFTDYAADGWTVDDLADLAHAANVAIIRGARVVVSYSDCPEVRELFAGWRVVEVDARRSIAANGDRTPAGELLLVGG